MSIETIAVFGGTGFLGRRIVARLLECGLQVRVAARNTDSAQSCGNNAARASLVRADVRDIASLETAVKGSQAAVNAVGLYAEKRDMTFHAVHVEGARNLAAACRRQGVERLLHISGIGAEAQARSPYVRCRGEGEMAVRSVFGQATVFRPSAIFAGDDAFLNTLLSLVQNLPAIPLFGTGKTRLQPVFADDVARAAVRVLTSRQPSAPLYALGGPEVYTYRQLLELLIRFTHSRPLLIPVPFPLWDVLAFVARVLPRPPVTEGQVALMKQDNVAPRDLPGLDALGIKATGVSDVLERDFAHLRARV